MDFVESLNFKLVACYLITNLNAMTTQKESVAASNRAIFSFQLAHKNSAIKIRKDKKKKKTFKCHEFVATSTSGDAKDFLLELRK